MDRDVETTQRSRYLSAPVHALEGFLDLYQATGDPEALQTAIQVVESIQRLFGASDGGYHDVCDISANPEPMMRPVWSRSG